MADSRKLDSTVGIRLDGDQVVLEWPPLGVVTIDKIEAMKLGFAMILATQPTKEDLLNLCSQLLQHSGHAPNVESDGRH